MVNTRSRGKLHQAKLEDVVQDKAASKKRARRQEATPAKRVKQEAENDKNPKTSAARSKHVDVKQLKKHDETDVRPEPVKINRAPVLHLFAACVAQRQHPDLSWETCLSLGSAVSCVCALAKGRAIGKIAPRDKDKPRASHDENEMISVMQFDFAMKDGKALVGKSAKPPGEGYLKGKFKDRYAETKDLMQESLESWSGDEETLAMKAFHMYERFRPDTGWGQSGQMNLELVKETISKQ
ncbi:hypothetical protein BCR37DRAFT_70891 [Protomyces lactucae-debilis]|uniref:Uncharacterized protein n=1 Tax=Protomyces lactucae-debilis TaxID=2754530 RepID=A0A1Y2F987_PROLT|nr:uncharacterized protein BCR37DRAFT_70891 [Protomyces lactucae-debilis]ORY80478.1 hypothetical protein BCR37DRAFT_70891 [Protomyces lactucae-debilis]